MLRSFLIVLLLTVIFCPVSYSNNDIDNRLISVIMGASSSVQQVEQLIKAGANVNAVSKEGMSCLHIAAAYNTNPAIARKLIELGADINAKIYNTITPLTAAKLCNNTAVASVLVEAGAEDSKFSPDKLIEVIANFKKPEDVRVFFKMHSINMNLGSGMTPLHIVGIAIADTKVASEFIRLGAKINAKNEYGQTPLHFAAVFNSPEIMKTFIDNGANLESKTNNGYTPLHSAIFSEVNPTIAISSLIKYGANIKAKSNSGSNLFHVLAASPNPINKSPTIPQTIKILLSVGIDINEKNDDGATPLMVARALNQNKYLINNLIKAGGK